MLQLQLRPEFHLAQHQQSTPNSLKRRFNAFLLTLAIIALLGFADATYLTIEHYSNAIPPCSIGSCETVLTSAYATVAGIPVALGGSIYYFAILVLLFIYFDAKKIEALKIALLATILGFVGSIYFFILQAFVIHAFCQYCLLSAASSTALFIVAMYILKKYFTRSQ